VIVTFTRTNTMTIHSRSGVGSGVGCGVGDAVGNGVVLVPDTQIGERCEQQVLSLTGVGTCVGAIVIGVGAGVGDNVGHTPPYNTHH